MYRVLSTSSSLDARSCVTANTHTKLITLQNPHCAMMYWFPVLQEYFHSEFVRSEKAKLHFLGGDSKDGGSTVKTADVEGGCEQSLPCTNL